MQSHPAVELGKYTQQMEAIGYYFNEASNHMATPLVKTEARRKDSTTDTNKISLNFSLTGFKFCNIVLEIYIVNNLTKWRKNHVTFK